MTSPSLPRCPVPAVREPVAPLGGWLFVPDRHNAAGDVFTGYLSRNGERVVLSQSSGLLAELARRLRQLESDFAVRITALLSSAQS